MGVVLSCYICGSLLHVIGKTIGGEGAWLSTLSLAFLCPWRTRQPQTHYRGDTKPLLKLFSKPQGDPSFIPLSRHSAQAGRFLALKPSLDLALRRHRLKPPVAPEGSLSWQHSITQARCLRLHHLAWLSLSSLNPLLPPAPDSPDNPARQSFFPATLLPQALPLWP